MYRVYLNGSMTALINTSSGNIETLKCNESKWDGKNIKMITSYNHTEQTTSYNGKSSWITEAFFIFIFTIIIISAITFGTAL